MFWWRILLLLLLFPALLNGQYHDNFTILNANNGLPQNSVAHICQDRFGIIWIRTAEGISRFNGRDFSNYNGANSRGIQEPTTLYTFTDYQNNLWALDKGRLLRYNYVKNLFETKVTNIVYVFTGDSLSGGIYLLDETDRLMVYSVVTEKVIRYYDLKSKGIGWRNIACYQDNKNPGIFFSLNTGHLIHFDTRTGLSDRILPFSKNVSTFLPLKDSLLYFCDTAFLYRLNLKSKQLKKMALFKSEARTPNKLAFDHEGNIWLCSHGGLSVHDPHQLKLLKQFSNPVSEDKSAGFLCNTVMFDQSHNAWVGSDLYGVCIYKWPHKRIKHFFNKDRNNEITKSIVVTQKNVIVGYYDKPIHVFSRSGNLHEVLPDVTRNAVTLFRPDSTTLIYNNYRFHKDLLVYNCRQKKTTPLVYEPSRVGDSLLKTTESNLAYAYTTKDNRFFYKISSGIFTIQKTKGVYKGCFVKAFGEALNAIAVADNGTIWAGGLKHLFIYDSLSHKLLKLVLPGEPTVKCIVPGKSLSAIIATTNGLFIISEGKIKTHLNTQNGLLNNFIYGALVVGNNIWFSHNKGISVYNQKNLQLKHYDVNDGLQANEFNTGAFYLSDNNELFFGGLNGFNSFFELDMTDNAAQPNTIVDKILVNDNPYVTDSSSLLKTQIVLPFDSNTVSFEFASLEFTDNSANHYKYKLLGMDTTWVDVGSNHFVRFSKIPPGTYTLLATSCNSDGVWDGSAAKLYLQIVPPFYKTGTFYVLLVSGALLVVFTIVYFYFRSQQQRLQNQLQQQQRLYHERERISRDLHDSVGGQLSYVLFSLSNLINQGVPREQLDNISGAVRNVTANLRETIWALNKEKLNVSAFSDKLKVYARGIFTNTSVRVVFKEVIDKDVELSPITALNLFRITQEIITNSFKHSKCTELTVTVFSTSKVIIEIYDNGQGFSASAQNKGYGLNNINHRAMENGFKIEFVSKSGKGSRYKILV